MRAQGALLPATPHGPSMKRLEDQANTGLLLRDGGRDEDMLLQVIKGKVF